MNLNLDTYSIGEAAKMIGSTVKTIRYYDEIGLVHPSVAILKPPVTGDSRGIFFRKRN